MTEVNTWLEATTDYRTALPSSSASKIVIIMMMIIVLDVEEMTYKKILKSRF